MSITAEYNSATVSDDATVNITISLKSGSYLDERYYLLTSDNLSTAIEDGNTFGGENPFTEGMPVTQKTTQSYIIGTNGKTKSAVTPRPLTLYPTDEIIKYGTGLTVTTDSSKENTDNYSVIKDVKPGEDNNAADAVIGFASGESFNDIDGIFTVSQSIYATSATGGDSRPTESTGTAYAAGSDVGYYAVNISNSIAAGIHKNYELSYKLGLLQVVQNTLAAPKSVAWDSSNPGTVTWSKVDGIGNVSVKGYHLILKKNDTQVKTYDVAGADTCSLDLLSDLRSNGEGCYTVSVCAEASTDNNKVNDTDYANVAQYGAYTSSDKKYAFKVNVAFSSNNSTTAATSDTVSTAKKIYQTSDQKDTASDSYILIAGETAAVDYTWGRKGIKADGTEEETVRKSGYSIDSIQAVNSDNSVNTGVSFGTASDSSATGGYSNTVVLPSTLTSTEIAPALKVILSLKPRTAEVSENITLSSGTASLMYGYGSESRPTLKSNPTHTTDTGVYDYKYEWSIKKGVTTYNAGNLKTETEPKDGATATDIDWASDTFKFPYGFSYYNGSYTVYCKVTAVRKDNGETESKSASYSVKVGKAIPGPTSLSISISPWTYGASRGSITCTKKISDMGDVTLYYRKKSDADTDANWHVFSSSDTSTYPTDAGDYVVKAIAAASENYSETESNKSEFTITKAKLGTPSNVSMTSSSTAPYGLVKWDAVSGVIENNDSTSKKSFVNVKYKVTLTYKPTDSTDPNYSNSNNGADQISVKEVETTDTEVDFTKEIEYPGQYFITVQALVDPRGVDADSVPEKQAYEGQDKANCSDGDSTTIQSLITIGAKIECDAEGYTKEYNGTPMTLKAIYSAGDKTPTYQWMKNGVAIGEASTLPECKITYVDDNASYACLIKPDGASTASGQEVYTKTVSAVITPRKITVTTADASKTYDGTAVTNSTVTYSYTGDSTKTAIVSGDTATINVTGSRTHVDETDKSQNTYTELVIKRSDKIIYTSTGTDNCYEITDSLGTLSISPLPVELTWSNDGTSSVWGTGDDNFKAVYTGSSRTVTAAVNNKILGDNVSVGSYTSGSSDNTVNTAVNAGGYTAEAASLANDTHGDYTLTGGSNLTKSWSILPKAVSGTNITAKITNADVAATGTEPDKFNWKSKDSKAADITPTVEVKDTGLSSDSQVLTAGTDYDLDTSSDLTKKAVSRNGSKYTIKVNLKGNYSGTIEIPWVIVDVVSPTGTVKFSKWDTFWNTLLSTITFGRYSNTDVNIYVTAKDEDCGSGLSEVAYYVFEKTEDNTAYTTADQLSSLDDSIWTGYEVVSGTYDFSDSSVTVSVPENNTKLVVVYVRIRDVAGHTTYISTDGITLETVKPEVSGIEAGKTYCISKEFEVADDNLDKVYAYVNGSDTKEELSASSGKYKLTARNSADTTYKIEAVDKAGNVTTVDNIRINKNHTWSYSGGGTDKLSAECTIDTCEYLNAVTNNKDISVTISATGGEYKGAAYTGSTADSALFDTLNAGPDLKTGTVGNVSYYKVDDSTATTGGTAVSSATDIGEYYAEATVTGTDNVAYKIVRHFSLTPVSLESLTLDVTSYTYSGTKKEPAATVKATVDGAEHTCDAANEYSLKLYKVTKDAGNNDVETEMTEAVNVGNYRYKATGKGNFVGTVSADFSITKETPSITVSVTDKVYDAEPADDPTWTATLDGKTITNPEGTFSYNVYKDEACTGEIVASSDDASYPKMPTAAGTYYLKASVIGADNFKDYSNVVSFTISPKPASLSWSADGTAITSGEPVITYDANEHTLLATVTNVCTGDTVTVTGYESTGTNVNKATNRNSYTATAKTLGGESAANYTLTGATNVSQNWSIKKAVRTLTVENVNVIYDGSEHSVTPVYDGSDKAGVTPEIAYKDTEGNVLSSTPVNQGTYTATVTIKETDNYEKAEATATVIISKLPVTITAATHSWTYDGTEHSDGTCSIDSSTPLVSGHAIASKTMSAKITNAGSVSNTITSGSVVIKDNDGTGTDVTANYSITLTAGTLTVDPKPLTTDDLTLTPSDPLSYTGSDVGPAISVMSDLNDDSTRETTLAKDTDYTVTENAAEKKVSKATAVGTYTVEITGKGNYTDTISKTYSIADKGNPVISGTWTANKISKAVENGGKYCGGVTITIADDNLTHVKITSTGGTVTDTVDEDLTVKSKSYTLAGSESGTDYTVTATDISGNTTTWTLRVWNSHKFTNYVKDTDKDSSGQVYRADCDHECGAHDYIIKPEGEVDWNYSYTYYANSGEQSGIQNATERETNAVIELYKDGKLAATQYIDCESECGRTASSPADSAAKTYSFTDYDASDSAKSTGSDLLPYEDADGNTHSYEIKVSPAVKNDDGTYSKIDTYNVSMSQVKIIPGDKAVITYNPQLFDLPWKVTLKALPKDESGNTVYPSAIYVKVLYGESEDAADADYRVVTQQAGAYTNSSKCTAVAAADGTYTYSGLYTVWQHIGGTNDSYYHRIQVVGYELNGKSYDVTDKSLKSICDSDHVNHTVCYDNDSKSASGTVLYELGSLMPTLVFDMNDGTGKTHAVLWKGINELTGQGGTITAEEFDAVSKPTRSGYNFKGWYSDPATGSVVSGPIDLTGGNVTVYARWEKIQTNTDDSTHSSGSTTDTPIIVIPVSPVAPVPVTPAEPKTPVKKETNVPSPGKTEVTTQPESPASSAEPEMPKEEQKGDGFTGNIRVYVETNDTKLGKLTADVPDKQQVLDTIMNDEIQKSIDAGESVEVRVTVDPKEEEYVPDKEKSLVKDRITKLKYLAEGITFGRYIDLKLDWRVFGGEWNNVPETDSPIMVTIQIPEDLIGENRSYYISHANGDTEELMEDMDDDDSTITIATSDFKGTYAILYAEKSQLAANCIWHWLILLCAVATLLILILVKIRKEEEDGADAEDQEERADTPEEEEKKRRRNSRIRLVTFALGTVLSVIFAILGTCRFDWPAMIIQAILTGSVEIYKEAKVRQIEKKAEKRN